MFAFQIKVRGSDRVGSVASTPIAVGDKLMVAIMWDDDFTFSVVPVEELQAQAVQADEGEEGSNLVAFPGGRKKDETTH